MFEILKEDFSVNRDSPKGAFAVLSFRLASAGRALPWPFWLLAIPMLAFHLVMVVWILGIELGYKTKVGRRLRIYHGVGLVVNEASVIGDDCVLRHGVTIGNRHPGGPCPVLGNRVDVGAGAAILGGVHIGDDARIGAGAIVITDVPAGSSAVGNPARIIRANSPF